MEREASITIQRPFHWGVVFVMAEESKGDIPEPVPDEMVAANDSGLSIQVHHAQDTDEFEGEYLKFAEVEIRFRILDVAAQPSERRREVYRGMINLPSGRLNVGDADDETIVSAHRGQNTIVVLVSADSPPDEGPPDIVWLDLLPTERTPSHVTFPTLTDLMGGLWSTSGADEDWPPAPDPWLFEPGDWETVEQALGTSLPRDYKELVGEGVACVFDDELFILSPFDPNPNCNLFRAGAENIWAIAYLRRAGWPEHAVPLFPEPGGLLGWGRDQNGAQYFWDTSSSDPETWGIVVDGRPVDPPMQRHRLGLTGYLDALRSGAVKSASYADWPSPDARIGRRAVE